MEDVKEQGGRLRLSKFNPKRFNPCFNGRCKRTLHQKEPGCFASLVSILVLMEDVKERYFLHWCKRSNRTVSILVLMEDVKEHGVYVRTRTIQP